MKKAIILIGMAFVLLTCAWILQAEEKANVAVLDFSAKNVSKDDADILADFFRSELIKTGKFNVLDRSRIQKIADEQRFQTSGMTDVNTIVKIGRMINAQYIFVGSYSRLDTIFMLNIEMINIQTGKIEKSESKSVENPQPKDKLDLARFIAYGFIGFGVGYELFWDGNRVGFEPEWSRDQAEKNLDWNRSTHTDKKVEGLYNGKKMN
ncbi:MAG: CsgG/HfaB family protein [Deltaproteobacteria bacterium]